MFQKRWLALPKLIRFMAMHFADGVALGWVFGLLLIWFDVCGIGSLLARYDSTVLSALFFQHCSLRRPDCCSVRSP